MSLAKGKAPATLRGLLEEIAQRVVVGERMHTSGDLKVLFDIAGDLADDLGYVDLVVELRRGELGWESLLAYGLDSDELSFLLAGRGRYGGG